MSIKVIFEYDEFVKRWDVHVESASDPREAREAFAAVVLSCGILNPRLLSQTLVAKDKDSYKIIPVE